MRLRLAAIVAALQVVACSSSTDPMAVTIQGRFTLDSVAGHRLPAFWGNFPGDTTWLLSMSITLPSAVEGSNHFDLAERDSSTLQFHPPTVDTTHFTDYVVIGPNANALIAPAFGPDSLYLNRISDSVGVLEGPTAFRVPSPFGMMYFSKH